MNGDTLHCRHIGEHRAIFALPCRQIIGHCYLLSQNRSSAKKVLGWAGLPPDTYNLVIKSPVMAAAGGRRGGGAEYPPPVPGPGGHISKDDRRRFIRLGLILGIRFGDEREEKLKPDL